MDRNLLNCYYHPERNAIAKCEKCGKSICLECNMIFRDKNDTNKDHYATHYDYCIVCYYDKKIKRYSTSRIMKELAFFILVLISIITILFTSRNFQQIFSILIYPIIIVSLIILFYIYKLVIGGPKKIAKFKTKKYEFLNSLNLPLPVTYCYRCGEKLDSDAKICTYCGNVIMVESEIR